MRSQQIRNVGADLAIAILAVVDSENGLGAVAFHSGENVPHRDLIGGLGQCSATLAGFRDDKSRASQFYENLSYIGRIAAGAD